MNILYDMCSTKYQFVVVDEVRLYSGDMTVHLT